MKAVFEEYQYQYGRKKSGIDPTIEFGVIGYQLYCLDDQFMLKEKREQILPILVAESPRFLKPPTQVPYGIPNYLPSNKNKCYNGCFLISVLQCLYQTPRFVQYCHDHSAIGATTNFVSQAFKTLENKETLDIGPLFKRLSQEAPKIRYLQQNDVGEALGALHTCLIAEILNASNSEIFKSIPYKPVTWETVHTCQECMESRTLQRTEALTLQIDIDTDDRLQKFDLQTLIEGLGQQELLDEEAPVCLSKYCRGRKKMTMRTYKPNQQKFPPNLMIVLQRFKGIKAGTILKVSNEVTFPNIMHLEHKSYSLYGIIMHHGVSGNVGHYTSFVKVDKDSDGKHLNALSGDSN